MNAEERLSAYLCSRPGTERMDQHHADFARDILNQHAKELADARSSIPFGRTEGLTPDQLADMLRDDAIALAASIENAATVDDPLTLVRCLHATVEALTAIAPAAFDAAWAGSDNNATHDIRCHVRDGLTLAQEGLWAAANSI